MALEDVVSGHGAYGQMVAIDSVKDKQLERALEVSGDKQSYGHWSNGGARAAEMRKTQAE